MALLFTPGDDLVFQLESGYGLLRILAVDNDNAHNQPIWHVLVYEELFPDVESAEAALAAPAMLHARATHLALTDRALEKTPAARLGNRAPTESELAPYHRWQQGERRVSDVSLLLALGLR